MGVRSGVAANVEKVPRSSWPVGAIRQVSGGEIPQNNETFGYLTKIGGYAALNEFSVGLAESTCVAKLSGNASGLLNIVDLSALAMERSRTAREAIAVMGELATSYGYNDAGESLLVVDTTEAFVFHVLPDDTRKNAVWIAQRVPDDHVAVVANAFTIRLVDFDDHSSFLYSANIRSVALRQGFWSPVEPFDFCKVFSGEEPGHKYASGRRMWYAYSLLAPSVALPSEYSNLIADAPYPTTLPSIVPGGVHLNLTFDVMRSWFKGTQYDMGNDTLSGGAWGSPDRWVAGEGEATVLGNWERNIATSRSILTYVIQTRAWLPHEIGATWWLAMHAAHTSVYIPFVVGMSELPIGHQTAQLDIVGRGVSAWQASRFVFNICQLKFDHMIEDVRTLQQLYEGRSHELRAQLDEWYTTGEKDLVFVQAMYIRNSEEVVSAWWDLADSLILHYADGFCNGWAPCMNSRYGRKIGYPAWWLKAVNFSNTSVEDPLASGGLSSVNLVLALALAIGSSTDNFAVGVSLGIAGHAVNVRLVGLIACANAVGSFVSTYCGQLLGSVAPHLASFFSAAVFAYLAYGEAGAWWASEESPLVTLAADGVVMRLAVPMTLNNIAGGVAGGVAGVSPLIGSVCVLLAAGLMMAGGQVFGQCCGRAIPVEPALISACIFGALATYQLFYQLGECTGLLTGFSFL
jgi:dipeptidase/putative Mn2+ efflux pump MntP